MKRDMTPEELEAIQWQRWHAKLQKQRLADIQRRLCKPYSPAFREHLTNMWS